MKEFEKTYKALYRIYDKHRRRFSENFYDSEQMCLMWSTNDPPDIIDGTEPFDDIETVFHVYIDENDAMALYGMRLKEAAKRIIEIQQRKEKVGTDT